MRTRDTRTGYGWISIALHWLTAILILTIWFIGSSIQSDLAAGSSSTLRLHTSIAISAYVLLWVRVVWRFKQGHPDAMPEQRGVFYEIGKYTHYAILTAVAAMLISGPLMVWSRGEPIYVFDWFTIPGPFGANMDLYALPARHPRVGLAHHHRRHGAAPRRRLQARGVQPGRHVRQDARRRARDGRALKRFSA